MKQGRSSGFREQRTYRPQRSIAAEAAPVHNYQLEAVHADPGPDGRLPECCIVQRLEQ